MLLAFLLYNVKRCIFCILYTTFIIEDFQPLSYVAFNYLQSQKKYVMYKGSESSDYICKKQRVIYSPAVVPKLLYRTFQQVFTTILPMVARACLAKTSKFETGLTPWPTKTAVGLGPWGPVGRVLCNILDRT